MTERTAAFRKGTVGVLWLLRGLVALVFLAAGGSKLVAAPAMVAMFVAIGIGQWFRLLTGTLEVAGAIGLLLPRVTIYAALLLMAVMVGAIVAHLSILGGSPLPAIVLLLLSAAIAWLARDTAIRR
jgi:putative oxidoreductase